MAPRIIEDIVQEQFRDNAKLYGEFPRVAEPIPSSFDEEARKRAAGFDVGFAFDPDADRLLIIDEMYSDACCSNFSQFFIFSQYSNS